ncbi:NAD(P)H-binding protein [Agrococcus beijingensis]|uniref:NAD(P)H-binding protein n=1 Tax=Agrococcus beijingensis TaxID=3068634 RepID=UPI0027422348|nr:NAD(P)H-binding protein [Agrococcus sp. REN33]
MRITVIGASGMVGSAAPDEALRRGHSVTAVARQPPAHPARPGVTAHSVAADDAAMRPLLADADAAVVAIRARPGEDSSVAEATATLLDAAAATGTRLLIVGGAGPLRTPGAPHVRLVDNPDFVPVGARGLASPRARQQRAAARMPAARLG